MSITANIANCPTHGLHGEREECYVCGQRVEQIPLTDTAWLLWGRKKDGTSALLGAYINKEVALDAEGRACIHPNQHAFADFWVTPWPLAAEPRLNFRMDMP
jgi:hypothetical protein